MKITYLAMAALAALVTSAQAELAGEREFMTACAVCHGESGKGMGHMADVMDIAVPSLTTLAANNDGVFPFLDVLMVIDGRTGVRGHGSGAMPVWGDRYKAAMGDTYGPYGTEVMVRGRLLSLVYYLESIQE